MRQVSGQPVAGGLPYGSTFNNPAVRQALENLGNVAGQPRTALHVAHNVLNGGEISPEMLARFDQPRYQTGCEKLLNMVPMPQGGITKRPALLHAGPASGVVSKLFPFIFSAHETRMLELFADNAGNCRVRVWYEEGSPRVVDAGVQLPYTSEQLRDVEMAQCGDVVYLAEPHNPPAKMSRFADNDWKYEVINWLPSIETPTITNVGMVGQDTNAFKVYDYVATAVDRTTGEESLPSPVYTFLGYTSSESFFPILNISTVPTAGEYRIYKKRGGVFGYIGSITADENTGAPTAAFNDNSITPDTADTPPKAKDPFADGNFPRLVFFHQQRLCFASSDRQPMTIWMSQSGNFESMAASLPPAADDAIEVTLATTQASRIVWCMSDRTALAVGTEGGEWLLTGTEGQAITPSDLFFQPQTSHGSEPGLPALMAGSGIIYMQRGAKVARAFGYSFNSDKYESGDLSLLARHILQGSKVVAWAWQDEPYGIAWCVLADGSLAGMTYMREQDVIAWHRHRTAGRVLAVATMPGAAGNTRVWFVVEREGTRRIELMDNYFNGDSEHGNWFRDGDKWLEYEARCIPCLPESQLQDGTTFMRPRKINAVKARVIRSGPFRARMGESGEMPVPVRGAEYTKDRRDWALPIAAGWRENDRLELIFDGHEPVTVLGLETVVEVAEMSGGLK